MVQALGVSQDSVNKDLLLYKSILSKMAAAKVRLFPRLPCRFSTPSVCTSLLQRQLAQV